jgi:hypothetical protein
VGSMSTSSEQRKKLAVESRYGTRVHTAPCTHSQLVPAIVSTARWPPIFDAASQSI